MDVSDEDARVAGWSDVVAKRLLSWSALMVEEDEKQRGWETEVYGRWLREIGRRDVKQAALDFH